MSEQTISVEELFTSELDALNEYIVYLENREVISNEQKKELEDLKVVAQYLIDRLNNKLKLVEESYTIH
ncbi:MAG: hypothetical protein CBC05_02925 [Crocinitomicaceae bacterium TMED45]|nr:MAG: hypothetical protein CBC05_02925 [Crocinitomicaceae bacterium TMED45]|tara:strand:- start:2523 stop:2729 length:207 start_codon:yes stop_codon:yes gene_type:complete